MHWPEYNPRKRQNTAWRGLAVLLTLAISALMAGELNGWWQLTPLPGERQVEIAPSTVVTTPASSAVVIATDVAPEATRTPLPRVDVASAAPILPCPICMTAQAHAAYLIMPGNR